jgi:hypothetical protein
MASNGNKDSKNISGGGGKDDGDDLKKIPFSKSSTSKTASSESPKSEKDINNNDTFKSPVKPVGKMNAAANLHTFRNNGGGDDNDDDNNNNNSSNGSFLNNIRPKTSNNDTSSLNDGAESSTIKSRNDNNWDESNGDDGPAPGAYEVEGRAVGSLPEWGRRITPPETSQESNRSVRFTDETARSSGTNNPHRTLRGWLSSMRLDQSIGREDSGIITATSVSDAVPIVYPDQIRTSIEIELEQKQQKRRHAIKWFVSTALVTAAIFLVTYFVTNKQGKTSPDTPNFCEEYKNSKDPKDPYVQCNCDDDDEITKKSFFTKSSTMEDYECWYTDLKDKLGLEINNDTSCDANNLALWWLAKAASLKSANQTSKFWSELDTGEFCTHISSTCMPPDAYVTCLPEEGENTTNVNDQNRDQRFYEAYALAVLYYSLNGKDWINTTGWVNDNTESPCDWYGIRCLGDGRDETLSSLDLENNNLIGPFPKEMSRLTHLRNLNLQSNHITGSMPHDFWRNMTNIRFVKLANNKINGTLPEVVDVDDIFEIHYFDISSNLFEGKVPLEFSDYPNLRHFDISNNRLFGFAEAKEKIPSENITSKKNFPRLDVLRMGRNQFNGSMPWNFIKNAGDLGK